MLDIEKEYVKYVGSVVDRCLLDAIPGKNFELCFTTLFNLYKTIYQKNTTIHQRPVNIPKQLTKEQKMHFKRISHNLGYALSFQMQIERELHVRIADFVILKDLSTYGF